MTRGVAALGPDAQLELTGRVAAFDGFNADSDPQLARDGGHRIQWHDDLVQARPL
nr:DUF3768 domain-containing protein [Roseobacter sp. TSBP12]